MGLASSKERLEWKDHSMEIYLKPGRYIDSDSSVVIEFAERIAGKEKTIQSKILALYYTIRDQFRYDPYTFRPDLGHEHFRAGHLIKAGRGYCIPKASLMIATARHFGIPGRLGICDVQNHIASQSFVEMLGTNIFVGHGFAELYLNEKWVKCTPAFDQELCRKMKVEPLDFNGREDSVFQQYNSEQRQFMEYLREWGTYSDVPVKDLTQAIQKAYPHLYKKADLFKNRDFAQEIQRENMSL